MPLAFEPQLCGNVGDECFGMFLENVAVENIENNEKGADGRKEWAVIPFDVKPGMNEISLPIEGVKAQSGRGLNLGKVTQWHFSYKFFPENAW